MALLLLGTMGFEPISYVFQVPSIPARA